MADRDSRAGTLYHSPAILAWTARLHAHHDAALRAAFEAPDREDLPAIQIGPSEGKLLALLLRLVGARKVVELGTLAGYSAIHLARALPEDGRLWSIEVNRRHAEVAQRSVDAAGLSDKVELLVGRGMEVLPGLERHGPFCAVFVDADKEGYAHYGRWAAQNVRPGGLLLGDNAFLFGELLGDSALAATMRRFHEDAREAFDTVCVPTPDGLLVGIKR